VSAPLVNAAAWLRRLDDDARAGRLRARDVVVVPSLVVGLMALG